MATNKNALIRYRTIDKCLQNRQRKWTLEDIINACSDALYEYEGKDTYVSKRTVQLDIQTMRSNKLGYNAPIVVYDKKYYTYEDESYSITNIPLTSIDMEILKDSVEMLGQFKDFSLFTELNGIIHKLEDKVYRESQDKSPIIYIEKNEQLKGLEHLDTLYKAIHKNIGLQVKYKSFKARDESTLAFIPYILKEFNNRWFIIGRKPTKKNILTLALDRISGIQMDLNIKYDTNNFNAESYYMNTIGVTVLNNENIVETILQVNRQNAPYVLTKPFHHSQKIIERCSDGSIIISLLVHHNFEFERLILGFGSAIKVIKPRRLKNRIIVNLNQAISNYDG